MARPKLALGDTARDTISGYTGIVTGMFEYLNGCIRVQLDSRDLHEGGRVPSEVLDIDQLVLVERGTVKRDAQPTGGPRPDPRARSPARADPPR